MSEMLAVEADNGVSHLDLPVYVIQLGFNLGSKFDIQDYLPLNGQKWKLEKGLGPSTTFQDMLQ